MEAALVPHALTERRRPRGRRLSLIATLAVVLLAGALLLNGRHGTPHGGSGGPHPDGQVIVRTVSYRSSFDGSRVAALIAVPRAVRSRGCFMWQFGFGSTKEESSVVWQGLASLGLTTVSIDFRFTGGRASSPVETRRVLSDPVLLPRLIRGTVGDLHSLVDYLERQPYCARNVAYGGVSLGGAIGTILAATDPRVRAAVLVATPGHWRGTRPVDPAVAKRPRTVAAFLRGLSPLDPARFVRKISGRPVLILSGIDDQTVPLANARTLQAAAGQPKTIVDYQGGHDPAAGSAVASNAKVIASFLLRRVVEPSYGIKARADGSFVGS